MSQANDGSIRLAARTIPLPGSLSAEAAQFFRSMPPMPPRAYPAMADIEGWRRHVAEFDAAFLPLLQAHSAEIDGISRIEEIDGVRTVRVIPSAKSPGSGSRIVLYAHGGALIYLGGAAVEPFARMECRRASCEVVAVDYRMPPDHPYPAALDDMLAVYRALLRDHESGNIAIVGLSAGSNIAAATALRVRDEGLPSPGAVVLFTPELDLTESGDSFHTLADLDVVLPRGLPEANRLYARSHDIADPYLSPIFADYARGFPPTFLQSGTRDLFLSNAVRMHRALCRQNLPAELHIWDGMPHGGFGGATPEDTEMTRLYQRFLDHHLGDTGAISPAAAP